MAQPSAWAARGSCDLAPGSVSADRPAPAGTCGAWPALAGDLLLCSDRSVPRQLAGGGCGLSGGDRLESPPRPACYRSRPFFATNLESAADARIKRDARDQPAARGPAPHERVRPMRRRPFRRDRRPGPSQAGARALSAGPRRETSLPSMPSSASPAATGPTTTSAPNTRRHWPRAAGPTLPSYGLSSPAASSFRPGHSTTRLHTGSSKRHSTGWTRPWARAATGSFTWPSHPSSSPRSSPGSARRG